MSLGGLRDSADALEHINAVETTTRRRLVAHIAYPLPLKKRFLRRQRAPKCVVVSDAEFAAIEIDRRRLPRRLELLHPTRRVTSIFLAVDEVIDPRSHMVAGPASHQDPFRELAS